MACVFEEVLNSCGCLLGYNIPLETAGEIPISSYPVEVYNVNNEAIDGTGITVNGLASGPSQYAAIWNSDPANNAIGTLYVGTGAYCFYLKPKPGSAVPSFVIGLAPKMHLRNENDLQDLVNEDGTSPLLNEN